MSDVERRGESIPTDNSDETTGEGTDLEGLPADVRAAFRRGYRAGRRDGCLEAEREFDV